MTDKDLENAHYAAASQALFLSSTGAACAPLASGAGRGVPEAL